MKRQPETPEFEAMVRDCFSRMGMMAHLGARISNVRPGAVEVRLSYRDVLKFDQSNSRFCSGESRMGEKLVGGISNYTYCRTSGPKACYKNHHYLTHRRYSNCTLDA